jgi:hypothetical protein
VRFSRKNFILAEHTLLAVPQRSPMRNTLPASLKKITAEDEK